MRKLAILYQFVFNKNQHNEYIQDMIFYYFDFQKTLAFIKMKAFFENFKQIKNNYKTFGLFHSLEFFEDEIKNDEYFNSIVIEKSYKEFLGFFNDNGNGNDYDIEKTFLYNVNDNGDMIDELDLEYVLEEDLKLYLQDYDIVHPDPIG